MTALDTFEHGPRGTRQSILERTLEQTPGLRSILWMSDQGEVFQAVGEGTEALERVASFAKGVFDLGSRLVQGAGCGEERLCLLQASAGLVAMHRVDDETFVLALADESARHGTLL